MAGRIRAAVATAATRWLNRSGTGASYPYLDLPTAGAGGGLDHVLAIRFLGVEREHLGIRAAPAATRVSRALLMSRGCIHRSTALAGQAVVGRIDDAHAHPPVGFSEDIPVMPNMPSTIFDSVILQ